MSDAVLLSIAVFQLAFIGALVWMLLLTEGRLYKQDAAERAAPLALRQPLQEFLVDGKSAQPIADELARLRPASAARQMERMGGAILAREQMEALAQLVRGDAWVVQTIAGGTSRHWWKRLAAARLFPMVCSEDDADLLWSLVTDAHPAVAAAATAAIAPHANRALVERIVGGLPKAPPTLRLQQMYALRSHAAVVSPLVVEALSRDLPAKEVQVMVQLAEIIGTAAPLIAIIKFAHHPDADVRATVARALRAAFVPRAGEAAQMLLKDSDWHVRAAAARALEGLRFINAVPDLRRALRDEEWWVRFRAAGALAALGEPGSIALEEAIVSDDQYASDMAIAIGGLSEVNRLDISG